MGAPSPFKVPAEFRMTPVRLHRILATTVQVALIQCAVFNGTQIWTQGCRSILPRVIKSRQGIWLSGPQLLSMTTQRGSATANGMAAGVTVKVCSGCDGGGDDCADDSGGCGG